MNASELSDELIDLIARGDRAAAILACYRAKGGDLENAWENVRRLSIELGESSAALPKSAAVDQSIKDLRAYLAQNFWERRKDQIQAGTFAIVLLGFVGYLVFIHLPPLVVDLRSYFWSATDAVIVKVRTYSESRQVQMRRETSNYMDYRFRYEVAGQEFIQGQSRVPYYEFFGESAFSVGDRVTISYNPSDPSQSLHKRAVYKRSIRLFFALILLVFAVLAAWYVCSRERTFRRLGQLDARLMKCHDL